MANEAVHVLRSLGGGRSLRHFCAQKRRTKPYMSSAALAKEEGFTSLVSPQRQRRRNAATAALHSKAGTFSSLSRPNEMKAEHLHLSREALLACLAAALAKADDGASFHSACEGVRCAACALRYSTCSLRYSGSTALLACEACSLRE